MASIIRFDNSCKIVDENDLELYKALDNELSFQIKGAEFSAAYQGYVNESGEFVTWDGRRHLLNSNGKFPVGLLPRVQDFFYKRGIIVPIIDQRSSRGSISEFEISNNLQKLGKIPRQYQIDAANTAVDNDRGIIRMATGSGKCNSVDSLHLTEKGLLDYTELLEDVSLSKGCSLPYKIHVSTSKKFGNTDISSMIYRDGYGPSTKITTDYGYTLTATDNHKIQILDSSGNYIWKKFSDLSCEDNALISYNNMMFGKDQIKIEEAYKLGLNFKDDNISKNIRTLDEEYLAAFIRGIYEKNAWVESRDSKSCIYLRLSSKKSIEQLHLILTNFGVISSNQIKKINNQDCYILIIYRDYINTFIKKIGISLNNKKFTRLKSLSEDIIKSKYQSDNIFIDKIIKIEHLYSDNYDFVIPNTHSFISQGFVNHNTMVSALITAKLGKRALILVIGKDLLYQTNSFFTKVFGQEIGIIGDGKCEIRDINVATIWSVGKALGISKVTIDDDDSSEKEIDSSKFKNIRQMLLDSSLVLLDECHLAACDTVQAISRNIKGEYVYGMSASPWRDDGADMLIEAFLGRNIVDLGARTLIKQGYLVNPDIRFLAPKPYKFKTGKYPSIYSKYIVENDQRNTMIVKATTSMVEQKFVPVVLFNTIKHGDNLYNKLKNIVPTGLLSGKDNSKQREKIKDELESGKIKCVIASKIYDVGVDIPILSGLVIAGAGKSSVRALQRIGRVIRPYPGKTTAAIVDFSDQAPYLNDHAEIRRKIYETEFNVKWPQERNNKDS